MPIFAWSSESRAHRYRQMTSGSRHWLANTIYLSSVSIGISILSQEFTETIGNSEAGATDTLDALPIKNLSYQPMSVAIIEGGSPQLQ